MRVFARPSFLLRVYGHTGRPASEAADVLAPLRAPGTEVRGGDYYERLTPATPAELVTNPRSSALTGSAPN